MGFKGMLQTSMYMQDVLQRARLMIGHLTILVRSVSCPCEGNLTDLYSFRAALTADPPVKLQFRSRQDPSRVREAERSSRLLSSICSLCLS